MNNFKKHPHFVENQTLSHENLNTIFQYLDKEVRATRSQTVGSGILCGLYLDAQGGNSSISPGLGLTTEGHILPLKEKFDFKYYRKFEDKSKPYSPFDLKSQVYEVLAAVPEEEKESNLLKFHELPSTIRQGVVALYLENNLEAIKRCEGDNCDSKGEEYLFSLKVLLIPADIAKDYVEGKNSFYDFIKNTVPVRHPQYNIGKLKIGRPKITENVTKLQQLVSLFQEEINKAFSDLKDFLKGVEIAFPEEYKKLKIDLYDVKLAINDLSSPRAEFQQIYDWYETLFRALNEWISSLQANHFQCINLNRDFKRHLFLGSLNAQEHAPQLFRHYFEKAINDTKGNDAFEIEEILAQRVISIFNTKVNSLKDITVLPEKRSSGRLEDRAIPYFLNYDANKFVWKTSSDLKERIDFDKFGLNRKYLGCSLEDSDFFRIEGHIGFSRKEAIERLLKLRKDNNLEFDIKAIYVDDPDSLDKDECCTYESLRLLYSTSIEGFKVTALENFNTIFNLNNLAPQNYLEKTDTMKEYEGIGYEILDFRLLNLFENKQSEEESKFDILKNPEVFEKLVTLADEKDITMAEDIRVAVKEHETAIKEGASIDTEKFKTNEAKISEYVKAREMVEPAKENTYISGYNVSSNETYKMIMDAGKGNISLASTKTDSSNDIDKNIYNIDKGLQELMTKVEIDNDSILKGKIELLREEVTKAKEKVITEESETIEVKLDGKYYLLIHNEYNKVYVIDASQTIDDTDAEIKVEKALPSLMIDLFKVYSSLSDNIENFSDEKLNQLIKPIDEKIKIILNSMEEVNDKFKCHYAIKLLYYLLAKFSYFTYIAQLKKLNTLYVQKQQKLETKNILAKVVSNNPGIEHRAGVPIGGTFFLLVSQGEKAEVSPKVEEDFLESFKHTLRENDSDNSRLMIDMIKEGKVDSEAKVIEAVKNLELFEVLGKHTSKAGILSEDFTIVDDTFGDDMVIGDFCINSTLECCDLKYIVHTDLRLKAPEDVFCDDDPLVNLDVHPRGGSIFGPGTKQDGHTYSFDPKHPDVKIGKNLITYSIADEKVDTIIEVFEHPTAEIKILSKDIKEDQAIIEVEAVTTGADKYEWAVNDGDYKPGKQIDLITTPVKEDKIIVKISLRASNKACSAEDSEEVKLTDVQLMLEKKVFCDDEKAITLEGKPEGGTFSGEGVSSAKFDPSKIKINATESGAATEITYTVTGQEPDTKKVYVFKHPQPTFEIINSELGNGGIWLNLKNTTKLQDGYRFEWVINGTVEPYKDEIVQGFKYVNGQVEITLNAYHEKLETCKGTTSDTVKEVIPVEPPKIILEKDIFCSKDKAFKLFATPDGGKFSGEGVSDGIFDPALIEIKEGQSAREINIGYQINGQDQTTATLTVIKHPEPLIDVLAKDPSGESISLRLANATILKDGYIFSWFVNGTRFSEDEEIKGEFNYVNGKVTVELAASHAKLTTCKNITKVDFPFFETEEPPPVTDIVNLEGTHKQIINLNKDNIAFLKEVLSGLNDSDYNSKILSEDKANGIQKFLMTVNEMKAEEMQDFAISGLASQLEKAAIDLLEASDMGMAGIELTVLGIELVTLLNIKAISVDDLDLGEQYKLLQQSIDKIKGNNDSLKYSLQELIGSTFWLNNRNGKAAAEFWKYIQP